MLLYHSSDSPLDAFLASRPLCVLISAHFSGFVGSLSLLSFSQMKHFSFRGSFGLLEVHMLLHLLYAGSLCSAGAGEAGLFVCCGCFVIKLSCYQHDCSILRCSNSGTITPGTAL